MKRVLIVEIIDINVHLGLKLYPTSAEYPLRNFVLNPAYKYGCECCVDGFYQQYMKYPDKPRLGIYNVRCRIPPQVEVYRQIEKGIVGLILNPINHSFSLKDERVLELIKIVEKEDLPLLVYTGRGYGNPSHLKPYLSRVPYLILIHSGYPNYINEAMELAKEEKVFFEISMVPPEISIIFKGKRVYGSNYPYTPIDLRLLNLHGLDEKEKSLFAKKIFKL